MTRGAQSGRGGAAVTKQGHLPAPHPHPGAAVQKPYVLLKDTAMVSTAFSNSLLSVSLLDS